jgi:hypothetical protein
LGVVTRALVETQRAFDVHAGYGRSNAGEPDPLRDAR